MLKHTLHISEELSHYKSYKLPSCAGVCVYQFSKGKLVKKVPLCKEGIVLLLVSSNKTLFSRCIYYANCLFKVIWYLFI